MVSPTGLNLVDSDPSATYRNRKRVCMVRPTGLEPVTF